MRIQSTRFTKILSNLKKTHSKDTKLPIYKRQKACYTIVSTKEKRKRKTSHRSIHEYKRFQ
jgi:hypothetical protein